ncbi:uncharacterized protein BT62DRAFT_936805 [Guyanagaster necrorhizus]|uniref:DUF6534 domain-containing protein n=1 Tax=Guyanagaster necrorhizus TaxID=856835 RepID=A0A9P7VJW5_9AGAR|nr:uncharacterized protein BT62DRAFT_936805 [Guyanagaster necrorhizus MCA 3950]KAG7441675.1 hypothetical protein BT62DRAFT_936805 [Guyanagaster necrorhizus MCA 3950]
MSVISDPFGMILVCVFLSILLLGVMMVQLFLYIDRYPTDPPYLKIFVVSLFALDVINSVFVMVWTYNMLIDNFMNPAAFGGADWIVCTDPVLSGLMASMVQGFFSWRVWVLTRNPFYFGFVVLCAIASTAGGIGTGIYAAIIMDFSKFRKIKAVALIWLISGALGDLAITLIITSYLRKARGTFPRTDRLLRKLIRLTMQNGLLTSLLAVVDFSLYLASNKPYYFGIAFLIPKLYTNSGALSLSSFHHARNLLSPPALSSLNAVCDTSVFCLSLFLRNFLARCKVLDY